MIRIVECDDCGTTKMTNYMVLDEVWYSVARREEIVCLPCLEKRLGRHVTLQDLRPCEIVAHMYLGAYVASHTPTLPKEEVLLHAMSHAVERHWKS